MNIGKTKSKVAKRRFSLTVITNKGKINSVTRTKETLFLFYVLEVKNKSVVKECSISENRELQEKNMVLNGTLQRLCKDIAESM